MRSTWPLRFCAEGGLAGHRARSPVRGHGERCSGLSPSGVSPCLRLASPRPGVSQDRLPQSLHLHLSTGSAPGATSRVCSAHLRGRRARSRSQMPEVPPSEFGITFGLWGSFSLKGHRPPFTWLEPHKQVRGRCGLTAPLCCPAPWLPGSRLPLQWAPRDTGPPVRRPLQLWPVAVFIL